MKTTTETVTPDKARNWLATSVNNRTINNRLVSRLASDITDGKWVEDGSPIRFNGSNALIDGQHRLSAIIMAGVPVTCLVVRDLPSNAFAVIDSGMPRRAQDILGISGHSSPIATAALARLVNRWSDETGLSGKRSARMAMTNQSILELVDSDPTIEQCANYTVARSDMRSMASSATWAFFVWVLARKHGFAKATAFVESIITGANIPDGDPRLALVRYLRNRMVIGSGGGQEQVIAVMIKTWNAHRAGKQVGLLKFASGDTYPIVE